MVKNIKVENIIKEVVNTLKAEYQPEKIILFGSYAYGQPNEDSDIDLFIVKRTDKRWVDRFVEVSQLLHDPKRGITVSPLIYTPEEITTRLSIGDDFIKQVLDKGEILYAR